MAPKVLVLGSNFAGLTAALALKHELQGDVGVTVLSKSDPVRVQPVVIWIPFGRRRVTDAQVESCRQHSKQGKRASFSLSHSWQAPARRGSPH